MSSSVSNISSEIYYNKLKKAYQSGYTPYHKDSLEPLDNSLKYYMQQIYKHFPNCNSWVGLKEMAMKQQLTEDIAWLVLKLNTYHLYDNRFKFYPPKVIGKDWRKITTEACKLIGQIDWFDIVYSLTLDADDMAIEAEYNSQLNEINKQIEAEFAELEYLDKIYHKTMSKEEREKENEELAKEDWDNAVDEFLEAYEEFMQ